MGYPLGAGTAVQMTIRHPAVVKKLVAVSTVFKQDGWYPEILAAMAQMGPVAAEQLKQSPLYQAYSRIAPRSENWPRLVTKMGDLLRKDYDCTKGLGEIKAPTMPVVGDADSIHPSTQWSSSSCLAAARKTVAGTIRKSQMRGWRFCREYRTTVSYLLFARAAVDGHAFPRCPDAGSKVMNCRTSVSI